MKSFLLLYGKTIEADDINTARRKAMDLLPHGTFFYDVQEED